MCYGFKIKVNFVNKRSEYVKWYCQENLTVREFYFWKEI